MAQNKQPAFPHPPLEVGVPQYPTPLVPDFYTKTGHIILVEKVSVEKGSYTPQKLDGSVVYRGRDAKKWPDTLYLVAERPTPDGEHSYRFWANDRTKASQDPWNYGLDYSENNPSYPVTSRQYIVPRSQYSPVALGQVDPVFGGTQIVAQQKMVELPDDNPLRSRHVMVQVIYESIPGPTVVGKTIGEFGLITTSRQTVVAGSTLPTPADTTVKLQIDGTDSVKSNLVEATYDSLNTLTGYQYDADLDLVVTNTKQIVAPGTTLTPFNGLLSSRDEPVDVWKTIRIQSKITSLPADRKEYKTGAYGSPNLVTGFTVNSVQFPNWDINVSVAPVMRAKRSYQTTFLQDTTYQYGQPAQPALTLFDPLAINLFYNGYFFKIDIQDCLTNADLIVSFTTASNDPVHGYVNETVTIPASTTSATTYLGLVGTYQLISYEIDYWKANIWRVVKNSVLLK